MHGQFVALGAVNEHVARFEVVASTGSSTYWST
jgi:hypothetical protein